MEARNAAPVFAKWDSLKLRVASDLATRAPLETNDFIYTIYTLTLYLTGPQMNERQGTKRCKRRR